MSDEGKRDNFVAEDAVYVPTLPYNLVPPQLLLKMLRQNGYVIGKSEITENKYIITYQKPTNTNTRTITILLSSNDLFLCRTSEGYSNFFCSAKQTGP